MRGSDYFFSEDDDEEDELDVEPDDEGDDDDDSEDVLEELALLLSVDDFVPLSVDFESPSLVEDDELDRPLVADEDDRESVMYHPLPLKTMPTGWITFRSAPPHCSQVVKGGSEKLCRFSIMSLHAVQV